MALTTLQLTNYQNEGFLVLNDFVDPTECDLLRDRIIEMIREFEPADVASIFFHPRTEPHRRRILSKLREQH
jgi:hypothetical protein